MESKQLFSQVYSHFRAGHGALVQVGIFYYPAHLIQKVNEGWRVKFWRENIIPSSTGFVNSRIYTIDLTEIVDSLWQNQEQ